MWKSRTTKIYRNQNTKERQSATGFITPSETSSVRTPDTLASNQDQSQTLSRKTPLPPIIRPRSELTSESKVTISTELDVDVAEENYIPLKLFDGRKQSLDELSQESMIFIWMRRMKELFLHMNDSKNNNDEIDPFVEFDMKLAKADMAQACNRYIENDRIAVMKQIREKKLAECDNDEASKKFALEKKQEWDMKKLYVEVFKMSYKLNRLKTRAEQDELTPSKTGDDQPNFGNAIWWYSCDKASIYYQINSIVRMENFELLMSYRYYLSDLCRTIEFMYQKKKKEEGDIEHTFYRADNISPNQLEMMRKKQKSQFITLLGFISTTSDINIAKGYAGKQRISGNHIKVLFVISVKPHVPCTAFAYIDRISFHPEEKEVLFSMGSSFMVEEILEPNQGENYHTIHLTACEIDKSLADDIRIKVANCSPSGRAVLLARYLVELGEYRAARKYLASLLSEADGNGVLANDISLAGIYNCLGLTYARQGLHGDALRAFKQALNAQARLEYSNNNALSEIHNYIGLAFIGLGYLDEAEATFDKATRMQLREPKSNQQFLASIYSNIGYVHYKQKRYDKAEKSFKNAEKLFKQNTSRIVHDALEFSLMKAEFLTNYGRLLSIYKPAASNQHPEDLFNEALRIYKRIVSDGDPILMQTYINIMLAFAQNKMGTEIIKCFNDPTVARLIEKQEANMFELNRSTTQANLCLLYELVGAYYASSGVFDKAIQVWKDAYIFERKARLERLLLVTTDENVSILTTENNRFIHEWYRKAANHYTHLLSYDTEEKQEDQSLYSNNICLGLLYAKLHHHHDAIKYLSEAVEDNLQCDQKLLFIASLHLADIFKRRQTFDTALSWFKRALDLMPTSIDQDDPVLRVEIKLAQIDCLKNKTNITELDDLYKALKLYGSDTKCICLKTIILDTIARYCLTEKQYEKFEHVIENSIALKQGSLSQYHPSLAIDFILQAEFHVQKAEEINPEVANMTDIRRSYYREALRAYERALEVYNLNLSNNNLEMKKIYYAMGNIMCDMDELPNAMEKYEAAEANYSDEDENNKQILEEEESEESVEMWMARANMHQHLAEYRARKKDYKEAIVELKQAVNLYSKQLPSSLFDSDDKQTMSHDVSEIVDNLRRLAQCYVHLGDIMGTAQTEDDGYFIALNIYTKLISHDKKLDKDEASLYEKISAYYEHIGDYIEAVASLRKAIELGNKSVANLYAVARLSYLCHELNESEKAYQELLVHPSIGELKHLKHIVHEKLNAVRTLKNNQNLQIKTLNSSDDPKYHNSITDFLNQIHGNTDSSSHSHDTNELNTKDEHTDYRSMANSYLFFQDFDTAMKFYENDIKQRSKSISETNAFSKELDKIDLALYTICHLDILPALPKLFHSLVDGIQKIVTNKDSDISVLADSYNNCGQIHTRLSAHMKAIKAYVAAFGWYAADVESTNQQLKTTLVDTMRNLVNAFVESKLTMKQTIDIYIQLSLPNEADRMRLKLVTMRRGSHLESIDETHGSDIDSHESQAKTLQHYKALLMSTTDLNLKGVCYYNILRLYKHHLHPDQSGKEIVDNLKSCLSKFNNLDRHILSQMAIEFLLEYSKHTSEQVSVETWQILVKDSLHTESSNSNESCIGLSLFDIGNLPAAEAYWHSIIKQIEGTMSSRVLELVYDADTTFKELLKSMQQFENENLLLCDRLVIAYEKLGDYYVQNTTIGGIIDPYWVKKIQEMYNNAIHLLKRFSDDTNHVQIIKAKCQQVQEMT